MVLIASSHKHITVTLCCEAERIFLQTWSDEGGERRGFGRTGEEKEEEALRGAPLIIITAD